MYSYTHPDVMRHRYLPGPSEGKVAGLRPDFVKTQYGSHYFRSVLGRYFRLKRHIHFWGYRLSASGQKYFDFLRIRCV